MTPLSVLSASYNQLGVCLTTVAWTIDRLTTGFVWLSRPFFAVNGKLQSSYNCWPVSSVIISVKGKLVGQHGV